MNVSRSKHKKETHIEEIMMNIDNTYKSESVVYQKVKKSLNKLNQEELSSLYVMIGTSLDK